MDLQKSYEKDQTSSPTPSLPVVCRDLALTCGLFLAVLCQPFKEPPQVWNARALRAEGTHHHQAEHQTRLRWV